MDIISLGFFKVPSWSVFSHFIHVQVVRPFGTELLRWEWLVFLVSVLLCANPWLIPGRWLTSIRIRFHRYAQNRSRAIWTAALLPIIIRLALLPAAPLKPPSVHDEFSLLLMADTLSSGRLTNPTPPYWKHFETIHVIQKPTYTSMYPPGFGAFLAIGQLLGHPWIGVLLTFGLMSAAITWTLQAWLPPAWALGGALIIAMRVGVGGYWMNSYVGGAPVPAMAGALLLGALPRFLKRPTPVLSVIFATGIVFLINTRPFEGTALSLACCGAGVWWWRVGLFGKPAISWRAIVPGALVLVAGGSLTGYYCWRVTGNPLKMAYVVNRETYGWPENLAILPPQQHLTFHHKILETMHRFEVANRQRYATLGRMLDSWSTRAVVLWWFFIGPGLTCALLVLPWIIQRRKLRAMFYIGFAVSSLNTLQLVGHPQHVSAQVIVLIALLTAGLRRLYLLSSRIGVQPERVIAVVVLSVTASAMVCLFMEPLKISTGSFWEWPHIPFFRNRAAVLSKLQQMPGKHLVFVRYADDHSPHEEWVYNAADLQKAKVIWANSMGLDRDMELRKFFPDRQPWLVEPDIDQKAFWPFTRETAEHDKSASSRAFHSVGAY